MSDARAIPTPAPADRPTFKILVEGQAISGEYQVQSVTVYRSYNQIAAADLLFLDGDPATEAFRVSDAAEFVPGAAIEILAGYHGDEESIFKGIVIRHGLRAYQERPSVLRVSCRDAAVKLTVGRRSAYYYEVTDSDVIEELADGASLQKEVEATSVTHASMVQFNSTDWDFIVTRAEANGKLVLTRDGTLVVHAPDPAASPSLALTYGSTILDFEASMDARDQVKSLTASAWDAANQERLEIDGADSSAASPGNVTADELADVLELDPLLLRHGGLLPDSELQAWADARRLAAALAKVQGRVRIQGVATVSPGDVIELDGVGDRFNGNALVSGVRHAIDSQNWITDLSIGMSPDAFGVRNRDVIGAPANGLLPAVSGLEIGLVTALEDPDGEDRVQVRIPRIDPAEEGVWARVAALDAGEERGTYFRPEIGDEVVLGFLGDDPRNPIILGMLNSSAKPAPITAADDNHEKGIVTRSGMKILFNDEVSTISIETPNENKLLLTDEDGGLTLTDENGNTISMTSDGITLDSAADVNITAAGDVNISGSNVSTTASAELTSEGSAGAKLTSGGSTVVEGSIVQIN